VTLRLALVTGPMYEGLYRLLDGEDVEVTISGDHPSLNRAVAEALTAGERLDVISTHGKYAPSQAHWLRPLDDLVDMDLLSGLAPRALDLCRDRSGALLCVPRNIDVRVLWRRDDVVPDPPDTWAEVLALTSAGNPFGFPQRDSGLFGTFFEAVLGLGGRLLDEEGAVVLNDGVAEQAVTLLRKLAATLPAGASAWHYDDVDRALGEGRVAVAAAWPGGTEAIRHSSAGDRLRPSAYPAGLSRRVSYAGCHGWAIPLTAGDVGRASALVARLAGEEAGRLEARSGAIPAHVGAAASIEAVDAVDEARLDLVRQAISSQMATYPPHPRFASFEDGGWRLVADVVAGRLKPKALAPALRRLAELTLRSGAQGPGLPRRV